MILMLLRYFTHYFYFYNYCYYYFWCDFYLFHVALARRIILMVFLYRSRCHKINQSEFIKVLDKTGFLNDPPDGYAIWDHCESWFCWPIRRLVWSWDVILLHPLHSWRKILNKLHDKANWEHLSLTKHHGKVRRKRFYTVFIICLSEKDNPLAPYPSPT